MVDTTIHEEQFIFDVVNLSQDTVLKKLPYGMYEGYVKAKDSILIKSLGYKDTIFVIPRTRSKDTKKKIVLSSCQANGKHLSG